MMYWYEGFGLEAEDAIDCLECGGLYDARFYEFKWPNRIICPNCGASNHIGEALWATVENTEKWLKNVVYEVVYDH